MHLDVALVLCNVCEYRH